MSKKGLLPKPKQFADEYLRNGFNATRAYLTAYPKSTYGTAQVSGWHLLRKPNVALYVRDRMEVASKALQMSGDEALARLAAAARFDISDVLDADGDVLPPSQWPADAAGCVKSYQSSDEGEVKITVVDSLAANRTILEQTGKLKSIGDSVDALAEAIRADLSRGKVGD